MKEYVHSVQYYETDRMGVTHHSNYIRWMEEARVDFLKQIGWPYEKMEELGIVSPVIGVNCEYKQTTTFSDLVSISVWVEEYRGVKMKIGYEMKNAEGKPVCLASSWHCFLHGDGTPIRMAKEYPEMNECFLKMVNQKDNL